MGSVWQLSQVGALLPNTYIYIRKPNKVSWDGETANIVMVTRRPNYARQELSVLRLCGLRFCVAAQWATGQGAPFPVSFIYIRKQEKVSWDCKAVNIVMISLRPRQTIHIEGVLLPVSYVYIRKPDEVSRDGESENIVMFSWRPT